MMDGEFRGKPTHANQSCVMLVVNVCLAISVPAGKYLAITVVVSHRRNSIVESFDGTQFAPFY